MALLCKSILLIPDFALGVYRFVDRANIGASFIANSGLCDVICSLQKKLPVHHLMCEFEETSFRKGFHSSPSYYYWLNLHHFRRDLTYSDVRRFRIPSTAGLQSTADDCALILRYLSNSHVADFIAPVDHPEFSVKMLAALADRNGSSHFSMGLLRLRVLRGRLTDYRSVDAVFGGGMQLGALDLRLHEDCLQRLVEATDFLRMPVVQRLTEFKLRLINYADLESSRRPVVNSPMWTAGVHLLCNCALYQVEWQWHARADCSEPAILHVRYERHLESIALRLVQICEDFERGEVTATAAHSVFRFPTLVAFPFKVTNKEDPVTVVKKDGWPGFSSYTWDVYRFRNAVTGEWLTACVGRTPSDPFDDSLCYSMLHIVKGHVCPDASYVH